MDKLLPCPFCGGKADGIPRFMMGYIGDGVKCKRCGTETPKHLVEKDAIKQWNARHTPEGWQLVPVEFTKEQDEACEIEWRDADEWRDLYQAMLAAAPKWGGE